MPVVSTRARFVNDPTDNFVTHLDAHILGNGQLRLKGTISGSSEDDINTWDKDEWDSQLGMTEEFPEISIYLSFIGLAILGAFLSIFGGASGMRIAGALLGIIGGGLAIAGCFLLWNFNADFQQNAEIVFAFIEGLSGTTQGPTWSTFGIGWLATVASSGLILLGSILMLLIKPGKY